MSFPSGVFSGGTGRLTGLRPAPYTRFVRVIVLILGTLIWQGKY